MPCGCGNRSVCVYAETLRGRLRARWLGRGRLGVCVWSGGGVRWRVSGEEIETSRAVIDTRQTAAGFPPVLARVILLTAPGIVHTGTIVNEHVGIVWRTSPASSFPSTPRATLGWVPLVPGLLLSRFCVFAVVVARSFFPGEEAGALRTPCRFCCFVPSLADH